MTQPTGENSIRDFDATIPLSDYVEIPVDDWVRTDADRRETEIQIRMYEEGARAVREEVEWLEEHNFPIWIEHKGGIVDARTLPEEERARNNRVEVDLSRPKMILVPPSWVDPETGRLKDTHRSEADPRRKPS